MNATIAKVLVLTIGVLLLMAALLPSGQSLQAASMLSLTQTAEPPTPTNTAYPAPTTTSTATSVPPSATPIPPSATAIAPSATAALSSATPVVASATPVAATRTARPPEPPAGEADPQLSKSVSVSEAQVGQIIEYILTVTNRGAISATDVLVSDPLPSFLLVFNATTTQGLISVTGNTVSVAVGAVSSGQVVTIRIQAQIIALAEGAANTATLSTSSAGNLAVNDVAGATLVTLPAPAATATRSSVPPTAAPGGGASPTRTALPPGGGPVPTSTAQPGTPPPAATARPGAPGVPPNRGVSPGAGTRPPRAGTPPTNLPVTGGDAIIRWLLVLLGLGLISLSPILLRQRYQRTLAAARRRALAARRRKR